VLFYLTIIEDAVVLGTIEIRLIWKQGDVLGDDAYSKESEVNCDLVMLD
jgi:hypothetical protein